MKGRSRLELDRPSKEGIAFAERLRHLTNDRPRTGWGTWDSNPVSQKTTVLQAVHGSPHREVPREIRVESTIRIAHGRHLHATCVRRSVHFTIVVANRSRSSRRESNPQMSFRP